MPFKVIKLPWEKDFKRRDWMPVTRCGGSPYRLKEGGGGGGRVKIDVFGLFSFSQLDVIYMNQKIKQKNHLQI